MFGYIKPFKPQLRICEYDFYKAVYCGLCKEMSRSFGFFTRFTLSYDFAFLALLGFSVSNYSPDLKPEFCIAHPFKKSPCVSCPKSLSYPSAAAVISVYHKLKDDLSDKGVLNKFLSLSTLPFIIGGYKKAKKMYPELSAFTEEQMKRQREYEKEKIGLDQAAEPTAAIMAEMAAELSGDEKQKSLLRRFGYLLGRYVYFTDALDDLESDIKKNNFNPFLNENETNQDIIKEKAKDSVYLTLGELANVYLELKPENYKPILDNIVYLGLKNTFSLVYNDSSRNRQKTIS